MAVANPDLFILVANTATGTVSNRVGGIFKLYLLATGDSSTEGGRFT